MLTVSIKYLGTRDVNDSAHKFNFSLLLLVIVLNNDEPWQLDCPQVYDSS